MVVGDLLQFKEIKDIAPEAFVEADTRYMRHTFDFEQPCLMPMNAEENGNVSLWMVQRSLFDYALAQRAQKAGADLIQSMPVCSVDTLPNKKISVTAGREGEWSAHCAALIGADGANGVVARKTGLYEERTCAIAMEAEVEHTWGEGHPELRRDVVHLEYGVVKGGYAWVFPKDNHVNVGAGFFNQRGAAARKKAGTREFLQQVICQYLDVLQIKYKKEDLIFHAHPLPIWSGMRRLQNSDATVLLAGDAAGLVNPFFGDGIFHALRSGQTAAKCLTDGTAQQYTRQIADMYRDNFDSALRLSKFFYQWPVFCYRFGVQRPSSTCTAARLLCGEAVFGDITDRVIKRVRAAMTHRQNDARKPGHK